MGFKEYLTVRLDETSNRDVIDLFVNDTFPKDKRPVWGTENLKIVKTPNGGWALVNYATSLAYRSPEGEVVYNATKYSPTTSKIQTWLRGALDMAEVEYQTVTDQEFGAKLYD